MTCTSSCLVRECTSIQEKNVQLICVLGTQKWNPLYTDPYNSIYSFEPYTVIYAALYDMELKIIQASLDVMYDQNSISYKANI